MESLPLSNQSLKLWAPPEVKILFTLKETRGGTDLNLEGTAGGVWTTS